MMFIRSEGIWILIIFINLVKIIVTQEENSMEDWHTSIEKNSIHIFREGRDYKTSYLDDEKGFLYIGARDSIYKLDMKNISNSNKLELEIPNSMGRETLTRTVYNNITVIQPFGNGKQLFICGTYGGEAKNWIINKDLTHPRGKEINWQSDYYNKCQDKSFFTSLMVNTTSDEQYRELYSTGIVGYSPDQQFAIFRTHFDVNMIGNKLERVDFAVKSFSPYFLYVPGINFVGSFDLGNQVLFFFSELGYMDENNEEYLFDRKKLESPANTQKRVYLSRVGRVCKEVSKSDVTDTWHTFAKARLTCSTSDSSNKIHFNNITSIYKVPGEDTHFYGIFKYSDNMLKENHRAICLFSIDDINKAFNGEFKIIDNSSTRPQPNSCTSRNSSLYHDTSDYFLMENVVNPINETDMFNLEEADGKKLMEKLVVDVTVTDNSTCKTPIKYTTYYVLLNNNEIYKLIHEEGKKQAIQKDIYGLYTLNNGDFDLNHGEIIAMEYSSKFESLYVVFENQIVQLKTGICERYKNRPKNETWDPRCLIICPNTTTTTTEAPPPSSSSSPSSSTPSPSPRPPSILPVLSATGNPQRADLLWASGGIGLSFFSTIILLYLKILKQKQKEEKKKKKKRNKQSKKEVEQTEEARPKSTAEPEVLV